MAEELRTRSPRMAADRHDRHTRRAQAAIQLEEEQRVGEFAVAITLYSLVTLLGIEIIPVEVPRLMGSARGHDDSRPFCSGKLR